MSEAKRFYGRGGRAHAEQSAEDLYELLKREVRDLTPEEQHTLRQLLEEVSSGSEKKELLTQLHRAQYVREPVPVRQFVLDEYYLGKVCYNIFPRLLADLEEVFSGDYTEVVFTGAIGTGKTYASSIGICRVLYDLSCRRDPQASFGLSPDTTISVACFSVNEKLARDVALKNIIGKIAESPYFKEHFKPKILQKEIRFPNNVSVHAKPTNSHGVLGMNILAGIVDEINFMPVRHTRGTDNVHQRQDMAKVIYDSITRRMRSRYGQAGKMFLPSSKASQHSFLAGRIKAAETDPKIFIRDYALWDVRPENYGDDTFWVLCGNEQVNSVIVDDPDELARLQESRPERTVLIEVPQAHRPEFESDLEGSIRDVAGVATAAVSPFIQRYTKIGDMVDPEREHPFAQEEYDPSVGGGFLWNRLVEAKRVRAPGGQRKYLRVLRPQMHPNAHRAIHIDLAKNQCAAGFCMAHQGGWKKVERRAADGRVYYEEGPLYVIDVVLRIVPPTGDDLDFGIFRRLVYELLEHGFPIRWVSSDQWNSIDMLQMLQQRGLRTSQISMDRNWDPYQNLKEALYEDRLRCYDYKPLQNELRLLEANWEKRRVDKQHGMSKDVADAVAGACYSLRHNTTSDPIMPVKEGAFYPSGASAGWMLEQQQARAAARAHAYERDTKADDFFPDPGTVLGTEGVGVHDADSYEDWWS